ncbi:MAG: lactonase family protein [Bacteroidota bacterium]|nr:lactonase family protein [Bacteroidota bacterium]MDP4213325.1 lactonase family protein [Bacteroidota bacterium]MDP4251897.1 lactonase family protein [Bacteroidota bacterium]
MRWIILLLFFVTASSSFSQNPYLFVGTYTNGKSKGIYVFRFDSSTGTATEVSTVKADNPSYLAIAPDGKHIYSANESAGPVSSVGAYSFDPATGRLLLLNNQSSQGSSTCYVSEDKSEKWVMVANYGSGSLSALPVNSDGSLAPAAQVIQHYGSGINKERQEKPHVHSTIFSPDEKYLYVADLGTDKEHIYHFDPNQSKPLTEASDSFVSVMPGSGPRHIVFHPAKPDVYLISEMSGTIDAFHYHENSGKLVPFQRIRTTTANFTGRVDGADIHIGPDGRFLYASNRGVSNTLAVFAIGKDGKLTNKQYVSVNGKHPRNFAIDPTGRFLLVANQDSDNIVVFAIDPVSGLLKATGKELSVPNPVCVKFLSQ